MNYANLKLKSFSYTNGRNGSIEEKIHEWINKFEGKVVIVEKKISTACTLMNNTIYQTWFAEIWYHASDIAGHEKAMLVNGGASMIIEVPSKVSKIRVANMSPYIYIGKLLDRAHEGYERFSLSQTNQEHYESHTSHSVTIPYEQACLVLGTNFLKFHDDYREQDNMF